MAEKGKAHIDARHVFMAEHWHSSQGLSRHLSPGGVTPEGFRRHLKGAQYRQSRKRQESQCDFDKP